VISGELVVDKFEKGVKRVLAPIIAYTGWEDAITDEMKNRIQMERLANPLIETATDYEAMVYLHTASLATPLSREMTDIYSYLFSKYHAKQAKEIGVYAEKISELEERELSNLKDWIFRKQMKE
jgi:hypothetical protein